MGNFLSTRLFQIGETRVTVSSLLVALAILVGSFVLARLARQFVADRLLGKTRLAAGTRYAIGRVLGYVILFLGVLVALQPLGVNATTLAVFGGALGIGLGFGLQDVVKNFVAGLVLLVERPIQVGDSIEVTDVVGDVIEIRARATVVRTNDGVHLIVPNAKLVSGTIVNRNFRLGRVREHVPVAVATDSDPADVEAALLEAASGSENILAEPAPKVWFREFGESALRFELLCWTSKMLASSGELRSELNHRIYQTLRARAGSGFRRRTSTCLSAKGNRHGWCTSRGGRFGMARDEIEGRRKRGGDPGETTGEEMTRERAREGESATGRAGGTGRFISPEEEEVPRKSPGTDFERKQRDEGGI